MDYAHDERQRQILRLAFTAQLWGRPWLADRRTNNPEQYVTKRPWSN
jgi:hypothetical protein